MRKPASLVKSCLELYPWSHHHGLLEGSQHFKAMKLPHTLTKLNLAGNS
uniref:Uncharacterized protein n=1 Tax=Arundo donax TaxID=35708 RepID=A0A0A9B5M4_ARUDO